jgi:hypothetical protein
MNAAQRKTLQAILEKPTRADVRWSKIEGLVRALGGEVTEGRGSASDSGSEIGWRRSTDPIRSVSRGRQPSRM